MSAHNGDRARHHKNRVRKLLKRQRVRTLLAQTKDTAQAGQKAKGSAKA